MELNATFEGQFEFSDQDIRDIVSEEVDSHNFVEADKHGFVTECEVEHMIEFADFATTDDIDERIGNAFNERSDGHIRDELEKRVALLEKALKSAQDLVLALMIGPWVKDHADESEAPEA